MRAVQKPENPNEELCIEMNNTANKKKDEGEGEVEVEERVK